MGKGILRRKNALKRQYLKQAVKYIDKLEAENEALKSDPNTVIGQFLGQYRELYSQNSRLSVLSAALLRKLGDKVELTKEEMEAFQNNRINIKWALPEGVEEAAEAGSYVFTYELIPVEASAETVQPTETPAPQPAVPQEEAPTEAVQTQTASE